MGLALAISGAAFAQNQRMVLYEGFTSATCPPCAPTNAQVDPLLAENKSKIIPIKYQTRIPSVGDPMYAQTKTMVDARGSYYSINSNPSARMDGKNNYFNGGTSAHPGYMTQGDINTEYGVTSPFKVEVSHDFSADYDSIFITVNITSSGAKTYDAGKFKLQTVLVEQMIAFSTPPSSNGEKEFRNVMRDMYPSQEGTVLDDTWTDGKTVTIQINKALPGYIYKKTELAVVAFLQNDSDKFIEQAAISDKRPLILDAAMSNAGMFIMSCVDSNFVNYTLRNDGTSDLTKATIKYRIDNGTENTVEWTGTLPAGQSVKVDLPGQKFTAGKHTLSCRVFNPNDATTEYNPSNDASEAVFNILTNPGALTQNINFEVAALPEGFFVNNPSGGPTWTRKAASGALNSKQGCFKLQFFNTKIGDIDEFIIPAVDLTNAADPYLTFNRAHARLSNSSEDLFRIDASSDCGETWTNIYEISSEDMATAPNASSDFSNPKTTQFVQDQVSLASLKGKGKVFLRFVGQSGNGNNLYIDDIAVSQEKPSGVRTISAIEKVNIYPNPVSGNAKMTVVALENAKVTYRMINTLGAVVDQQALELTAGENTIDVNAASLAAGVYQVVISSNNGMMSQRLVVK